MGVKIEFKPNFSVVSDLLESGVMASRHRILVIDDDPHIGALLQDYLGRYDFQVTHIARGHEGVECLQKELMHLVVLDIRLPDEDGFALLKSIRQRWDIPVIMLTGLQEETDRVVGLELGADDYLTKPFSPRELLARIRAVLRRSGKPVRSRGRIYHFESHRLDVDKRTVTLADGKTLKLTASEFRLLKIFLDSPGRLFDRETLLELCHPYGEEVYDRSIDVQILRLRRKLEQDPAHPQLIVTERGAGYRFAADVEKVEASHPQ